MKNLAIAIVTGNGNVGNGTVPTRIFNWYDVDSLARLKMSTTLFLRTLVG